MVRPVNDNKSARHTQSSAPIICRLFQRRPLTTHNHVCPALAVQGCGGAVNRIDRYGADSNSKKRAYQLCNWLRVGCFPSPA